MFKIASKKMELMESFSGSFAACYHRLKSNFVHRLLYGSKTQNFPFNLSYVPSHNYATEVYYHKLL